MKYYSTNGHALLADLQKAVVMGLAEDRGLYMPERIVRLPESFYTAMANMDFHQVACAVADAFFSEDIDKETLHRIVRETLSFDCPVVQVDERIWSLELFHGPTLAFKDVGARFMARMLRHFSGSDHLNVLVATSGDTGSAVANGFLGVEGINVYVLYPKGKVSPIQECQFTTLGRNITAIEVEGVFDDCQALVKSAFMDSDLRAHMRLTSANSINVARFLPQSFYYFWAVAQMRRLGLGENLVVSVPSGNFGNLCSALFARRMGLPVKRFIAANNANDVFFEFLRDGKYRPRASVATIANAMDVGDPSNFARIWELYGGRALDFAGAAGLAGDLGLAGVFDTVGRAADLPGYRDAAGEDDFRRVEAIRADISGASYSDEQIAQTIRETLERTGYLLDPHGACGYQSLQEGLRPGEVGVFCETAHPAKFKQVVESVTGKEVAVPERLAAFMKGEKRSVLMPADFAVFKDFLLRH